MKQIGTLKEFMEKKLHIPHRFIYDNSDVRNIFNKAFENYNQDKRFKCSEEKLLKIIAAGIQSTKGIELLCVLLSDEDLNELPVQESLKVDIEKGDITDAAIKKEIAAIKNYRNTVKDKNKFMFMYLLLNAIKINQSNQKILDKILSDNELSIEKIKLLENDEFKYILKKPFLMGLLKKTPLKSLKVVKEHAIKAKKGELND